MGGVVGLALGGVLAVVTYDVSRGFEVRFEAEVPTGRRPACAHPTRV